MGSLTLRKALSVLAKSSSFAVTTVTNRQRDIFDELKDQLFVKQDIETALVKCMDSLKQGEIIFLCGSSGDGKSEILIRCRERFQQRLHFHLDATHSFAPRQSAIDALDELFDNHREDGRPLVIGINTGMLANYAVEGAEQHRVIRSAIESFLSEKLTASSPYIKEIYNFFDFEHYPKFRFDEEKNYSRFIKSLLQNLTTADSSNRFYAIARNDEQAGIEPKVTANFRLLSEPCVQDVLITQLFKSRLIRDQFVTTRALLDLLHHLLLGPGYLFDNLFVGEENELVRKISGFDPARIHTQELDQFILSYELGLPDSELEDFLVMLKQRHIEFNRQQPHQAHASSLIRLFFLLRAESLGNNYHQRFARYFDETLLERYAQIWHLHMNYTGNTEQKKSLRRFYVTELISGIQRYANRKAPELITRKDELFLGEFGGIKITAPVELKPDFDGILRKNSTNKTCFQAHLKIGEHSLYSINISMNLFELLDKLNHGYRPNKYDKSAIVLLDEMVEHITKLAKSSSELRFYDEGQGVYTAKSDDDIITISGLGGVA
ncbi:DNA phosphorothioation-dependent restriction protein DptF [Limnobaculum parvum]|uniref:DNA phosphorothioation-dependent restriction protein DptF n=1 Tax=Limnobaculum parvum TaxID=2172103 RepID=A0A2Y9TXD8_9GAMM|nr:DNA phosphorothioation-dependent restriction protein DptF [Limnobaculum parvum]AWH88210.1 DNA phosphorothioation-dependent restriction protein DptF [Limnobaculum parvum]